MKLKSSKQLVNEAMDQIKTISPLEFIELQKQKPDLVLIDIRDIRELEKTGKIKGAKHMPRGMLEFWLDPESTYYQSNKIKEIKKMVLFCALGWRSALATKSLVEMGFKNVAHVEGGFDAQIIANHIEDAIAMVTEDVARQVHPFVPVVSGRLRSTLRANVGRDKAIGGTMPSGEVALADSTTASYHGMVEFGSGKGFNVGSKYLDRYFPVPEEVKFLKSSSKNRNAINSKHGKGAMMRRGARNTIERFGKSPTNVKVTTTSLMAEAKKLRR